MPFIKGKARPANAGKKKGSKHKTTLIKERLKINSWAELEAFIEGPALRRLAKEMDKLSGKDYERAFTAVAEFVKPKLTRTEHRGKVEQITYNVDVSPKKIAEIKKAFENDY